MADESEDNSAPNNRRKPNILVTGTPGVGKTSTAALIAERLNFKHVDVR